MVIFHLIQTGLRCSKTLKGDAHICHRSHSFRLSQLFICVCSSPFSVAAGNPLQLCYQEGPACPYKGKLTCGLDTCEFNVLIRSAAWLHSNLKPALEIITIALTSCTNTQYPPHHYFLLIPVDMYSHTALIERICTPQSRKQPSTCAPTGSQKVGNGPEGSLCSQMGMGVSGT